MKNHQGNYERKVGPETLNSRKLRFLAQLAEQRNVTIDHQPILLTD